MVTQLEIRQPRAWPKRQKSFAQEPDFHANRSSHYREDMSKALHAVANTIRQEYTDALAMYCANQPDYARGYLLRAEYVYQTYGVQENYELVPEHAPDRALLNRGQAKIFSFWVQFALHQAWNESLLSEGLQDLYDYLMQQTYDENCADQFEDQLRLFTVLCQMAMGRFEKADTWMSSYVAHRGTKRLKENLPELLVGIQAQLQKGSAEVAEPLRAYFDQNRLGIHKFAESQAFWLCVPIAVILQRAIQDRHGQPNWAEALEHLLY